MLLYNISGVLETKARIIAPQTCNPDDTLLLDLYNEIRTRSAEILYLQYNDTGSFHLILTNLHKHIHLVPYRNGINISNAPIPYIQWSYSIVFLSISRGI